MHNKVLKGIILSVLGIVFGLAAFIYGAVLGMFDIFATILPVMFNFGLVFSSGIQTSIGVIIFYVLLILSVVGVIVSIVKVAQRKNVLGIINISANVVALLTTLFVLGTFGSAIISTNVETIVLAVLTLLSVIFGLIVLGFIPHREVNASEEAVEEKKTEVTPTIMEEPETSNVVTTPVEEKTISQEEVKEEPVVEETKEEVDEVPVEETTDTTSKKKASTARIYHISERKELNKWQIKFAGGERALKFFNTQTEAIAYAKELIAKNGGSYRVHSRSGKLRKA